MRQASPVGRHEITRAGPGDGATTDGSLPVALERHHSTDLWPTKQLDLAGPERCCERVVELHEQRLAGTPDELREHRPLIDAVSRTSDQLAGHLRGAASEQRRDGAEPADDPSAAWKLTELRRAPPPQDRHMARYNLSIDQVGKTPPSL